MTHRIYTAAEAKALREAAGAASRGVTVGGHEFRVGDSARDQFGDLIITEVSDLGVHYSGKGVSGFRSSDASLCHPRPGPGSCE